MNGVYIYVDDKTGRSFNSDFSVISWIEKTNV